MSTATKKAGEKQPKDKTVRFNANIPEKLYRQVKVKAAQEGVKLNDLAIKWMEAWVKN